MFAGTFASRALRRRPPSVPRMVPPPQRSQETPLAIGLRNLKKGEFERAIARFQALIASGDPQADAARGWMVVALLGQGHRSIAEDELAKLASDDLDNELLYDLGCAAEGAGLTRQALQVFSRIYLRNVSYRDVGRRIKKLETPMDDTTRTGLDPDLEAERMPRRYTGLALLSRGGMGVILTALDRDLNRKVAIKLPNIVQIFDAQREPVPFFTMEFIEGQSLDRALKASPGIDLRAALSIGRQIALAVECLHSKSILHRDIKPENVIVQRTGLVKLVDFGLALSEEWGRITQPQTVLGTPRYMAPEVIGGAAPDTRADIFSLGVVLFELLSARHPFEGTGMFPQLSVTAPPLKTVSSGTPRSLSYLVDACIDRDPDVRPASASRVAQLLTAELARAGGVPL
ncbi:MAG: serine/threonine protein kinase [Candidatus Riflebacteria bacterium]|nr:serine/threonine protein kinase [Candidatus Riflebacteria bacterium]